MDTGVVEGRTWNKISSTHFTSASTRSGIGYGSFQPSSSTPSGGLMCPRLSRYRKYQRPGRTKGHKVYDLHGSCQQGTCELATQAPPVTAGFLRQEKRPH